MKKILFHGWIREVKCHLFKTHIKITLENVEGNTSAQPKKKKKPKTNRTTIIISPTKFWYSSTSTNTEGAQPEITMPPSPPPTSSTAGSHVRRGQRNDKHNRYKKAQTTANLATPRRPLHTPTSSPLTINSGLSNFMSPRIRLVQHI